ncbi:MAG: DUF192 domain-containing protein [Anaerolineales bacterium]|nr:DUF192 domain-containing protein [Anaerolineales bacterium]
MLYPELPSHEGLLLVQKRDSRLESAIHMLWMRFDLAVFWINRSFQVVDVCLARRWRLIYFPRRPASYVLEAPVERLTDFQIGEYVSFSEISLV